MGSYEGFTKKYCVHKLVYFETYDSFEKASHREKLIKHWKRAYKINVIERINPYWDDLFTKMIKNSSALGVKISDPAIRRG